MKKTYVSNAQINMTDYGLFSKILQDKIDEMQHRGWQVEVQYHPCEIKNGQLCLNALVLGYITEE